jgi:hypothetical protein
LLSTESALNAADKQSTAAILTTFTIIEAIADFRAVVQAFTLAPGLVFVVFGI